MIYDILTLSCQSILLYGSVLVYVLICTSLCIILLFVKTHVGFRNSGSRQNSRVDKVMGNTRIPFECLVQLEFRLICLLKLISVVNLTLYLIYLGWIDDSRALVYLGGIDHRILGSLGTIDRDSGTIWIKTCNLYHSELKHIYPLLIKSNIVKIQ